MALSTIPQKASKLFQHNYSKHHQDGGIIMHEGIKKGILYPLTYIYQKINDVLNTDIALSETQIATLTRSLKQLTQKKETL